MTNNNFDGKLNKLQDYLRKKNIQIAIINNPTHVFYFSGYSGGNGFLIVEADQVHFFTDPRYSIKAQKELTDKFSIKIIDGSVQDSIISFLQNKSVSNLAVTTTEISFSFISRIKEKLNNLDIIKIDEFVYGIVNPKEEDQIMGITNSLIITEEGLEKTIAGIRNLSNEIEFSRELQIQLLKRGAHEIAFSPIVAWEANSAEPHHKTNDTHFIGRGKLLIDIGAIHDGYYSDITRMVYIGEPEPYFRSLYEIVRTAKNKTIDAIRPGIKVSFLAQIVYDYFKEKNVDKYIGHYFGHGIGRKSHEPPIISLNSKETIIENSVIIIEPGLYINGWGGIRIEDTVLVEKDGATVLNRTSDQYISLRLPASGKSAREYPLA